MNMNPLFIRLVHFSEMYSSMLMEKLSTNSFLSVFSYKDVRCKIRLCQKNQSSLLRPVLLAMFFVIATIGSSYGQTFDGANITSTAQTIGNVSVLANGSKKNSKVCNVADVDYLEIAAIPNYLEIRIPDHATKDYRISLTASHNGSGTSLNGVGVLFSDESIFNETKAVIGNITTAGFSGNDQTCNTIEIVPVVGTKSIRIYRRVYVHNTTGILQSGSGSATQYGNNQTIRLTSVEVWATARPTVQTSNFTFANIATTSMDINFTRGNGSKVAVFAKENGSGTITNPTDNSNFNSSADWATGNPSGSQLGASGYFCVYDGTGSSFSLSNLKPNTSYTFQAFEYSGTATVNKYLTATAGNNPAVGQTLALTSPTVTASSSDVFSTKFTGNATITYNGGAETTEKGWVWGTSSGATINVNEGKIISGSGDQAFGEVLRILLPSTTYYARAYATNAIGTAYSNELIVTTAVPAPLLQSTIHNINFGDVYHQSAAPVVSYELSNPAADFLAATGNITVTAPQGYQVSLTASGGFGPSLVIPYTNGKLSNTTVYVQLPTGLYGSFTGNITHSGGGVLAGDADVVVVKGAVVQEEISNMGSDFWLGFGYMTDMNNSASNSNAAKMVVYVATGNQSANVTVTMPNGLYAQTQNIAANSIERFEGFPIADGANTGGTPDSRLFSTGIHNKGVNINSNGVPVSVWTYTYTRNNSSAGAMIFPTTTWSSSYTVQAYGGTTNQPDKPYEGRSNQRNPNSFFYVIAAQDNTVVTIVPSNPIVKSTVTFSEGHTPTDIEYDKGIAFNITLNKGQIFNAQGYIEGSGARNAIGLDLSGTTITTGDCDKKIAVFAGNGRSLVSAAGISSSSGSPVGSDNMLQQMFPLVAWGTKYLTVPTKTMEYNVFRIYVRDNIPSGTVVKVNGAVLNASYIKHDLYYEYETNQPIGIESDKPISVTQLIVAESWGGRPDMGNIGTGDPEMIVLSPVQQAIKSTIVAAPALRGSDGGNNPRSAYINVVLQKEGINSFRLNGLNLALDTGTNSFDVNNTEPFGAGTPVDAPDAFKPHPGNPDYVYAKFRVEMGDNVVHTVSSQHPFNAIAYGLGKGESYAFNAGTAFRDLSSIKMAVNTAETDTSSTTVKAARGEPVKLKIALAYDPVTVDKITWMVPSSDASINPAGSEDGAIEGGKAKYDGTVIVDGQTFYVYSSPVSYTFSQSGSHNVHAIVTGTFGGDCGGYDDQKIAVLVGLDDINIDYQTNCGKPTISFTNNTTPMEGTTITKWLWDFGDGTTSDLQNPPAHVYNKNTGSVYNVKLTTTNTAGIVTSKTIVVDFSGEVIARYTTDATNNSLCAGGTVNFNSSSSAITSSVSGVPVRWTWNFGDGGPDVVVNGATSPVQPYTYTTPGTYKVSLKMETSTGCDSTFKSTITVYQLVPAVVTSESTNNSITYTWGAVTDATAYEVSTDNGVTFQTPSSGSAGTMHTVTGLQPDQEVALMVRATAAGTCESISSELKARTNLPELEIFIPNTFTPNGDGKNDELKVYGNYIQSVNIRIFNQWGEMIFHTTEVNKGWDGIYKGNLQPVGVYIYVVSAVMQDGSKINKKGAVNLIR